MQKAQILPTQTNKRTHTEDVQAAPFRELDWTGQTGTQDSVFSKNHPGHSNAKSENHWSIQHEIRTSKHFCIMFYPYWQVKEKQYLFWFKDIWHTHKILRKNMNI